MPKNHENALLPHVRRPARHAPLATLLAAALAGATLSPGLAAAAPQAYQVYNNPQRLSSLVIEDPHYHHAATVAQFGNRVYVAWNGNNYNSSEGQPGQVIMLKTSDDDGAHWSRTIVPFSKNYRALDETTKKGVDAAPGDADDDHKVANASARQWQPSMTVFRGKLVMFWGMDRDAPGSALMMSVLESDGQQWRSHEMHFKGDGTPYFLPEVGGKAPKTDDPSSLPIGSARAWKAIVGADALPDRVRLRDVPAALMKAENVPGGGERGGDVDLGGHRLVPAPNQVITAHLKDGTQVLAVSVILEQTAVDWNNLAVKIPAVLTTTDLEHWSLSVVPIPRDLLGAERGDIALVSAWEPTIDVDHKGNLHMEFRLNIPPRNASGGDPAGTGFRSAGAVGSFVPGGGVRWQPAHRVDLDVPASRATIARLPGQHRWVMAANHMVQGASYEGSVPVFRAEHYEPWARENISLFFSTRGDDDFLAGLNISGPSMAGSEVFHYPYIQSAAHGGKGDDLLVVFSTHRREPSCAKGGGNAAACHDSIRFVRIKDLPDPRRPAIYPNQFAMNYTYGKSRPQDRTYGLRDNVLTLVDRASAGIETRGDDGCLNLRFKWDGDMAPNEPRPVLSFGRTADRAGAIGVTLKGEGGSAKVMLGDKAIGDAPRGAWTNTRVCYDYDHGRLTSGDTTWDLGAGHLSQKTYLGDPTLARRDRRLADLSFDLSGTTLDADGDKEGGR